MIFLKRENRVFITNAAIFEKPVINPFCYSVFINSLKTIYKIFETYNL